MEPSYVLICVPNTPLLFEKLKKQKQICLHFLHYFVHQKEHFKGKKNLLKAPEEYLEETISSIVLSIH